MSGLNPIPESVEAGRILHQSNPDLNLLAYLDDLADAITTAVPECVALSAAWLDLDLSFTLIAHDPGGADCDPAGVEPRRPPHVGDDGLFDEATWREAGQIDAAPRVRSSLTIPLLGTQARAGVVGSVTLYADTDDAFEGQQDMLAAVVGGSARDVVRNADLSFATREASEHAPAVLLRNWVISTASGVIAEQMTIPVGDAEALLIEGAAHAGVSAEAFARTVLDSTWEV